MTPIDLNDPWANKSVASYSFHCMKTGSSYSVRRGYNISTLAVAGADIILAVLDDGSVICKKNRYGFSGSELGVSDEEFESYRLRLQAKLTPWWQKQYIAKFWFRLFCVVACIMVINPDQGWKFAFIAFIAQMAADGIAMIWPVFRRKQYVAY